jgi:hypothetical protein
LSLPRVYVDFLKTDDLGRIRMICLGTRRDLDALGIVLFEGLRLTLYSDDAQDDGTPDPLLVEGVIERGSGTDWVARIDRTAIRHESDL